MNLLFFGTFQAAILSQFLLTSTKIFAGKKIGRPEKLPIFLVIYNFL